jgi:hypothetical protein
MYCALAIVKRARWKTSDTIELACSQFQFIPSAGVVVPSISWNISVGKSSSYTNHDLMNNV